MLSKEISNRADESDHRNLEGFALEGPPVEASTARRIYSRKAVRAAAGIGVLALCAAVFYRVRELLAALILFSVLFGVVIIAVLILWLFGQATHEAAVRLEKQLGHIPARHIVVTSQVHTGHVLRTRPWN
jgi:Flp pilus assembly protein TadB